MEVFMSFFYFCDMASNLTTLGDHSNKNMVSLKNKRIGIVVSEWNDQVTDSLLEAARQVLLDYNAKPKNVIIKYVPGSFELTLGAQYLAREKNVDAVNRVNDLFKP